MKATNLNLIILATAAVLAGHANAATIASADFTGLSASGATSVAISGTPGVNGFTWSRLGSMTYSTPSVDMQSGTANALKGTMSTTFEGMVGTMSSSTTIPIGHTLTLSFIGQYTEIPGNSWGGLRFGFVNSGDLDNAFGMTVGTSGSTFRGITRDDGGDNSPLSGTTTTLPSVAGGNAVATISTSVYTASFAITRTGTDTYSYFGDVNGSTLTATGIVGGFDNYNAIFIRNGSNSADFQIDNVSVTLIPLSVWVTAPTDGQVFPAGSSVTATVAVAAGTAPYTVTFYTNGASAWSTNNTSATLFTIPLGTLEDGTYTNYATVTDSASPTPATATSATNTFSVVEPPTRFFWTNAASSAWGTAGNWTNDAGIVMAPVTAGQTNCTLNFNNIATFTATHNLDSGFLLNQLNFGGATATLAGSSLAFTNNGATLPQINQNSTAAITIGNDLILGADTTFGGSGAGTVTVSGAMSGAGGLTKAGTGTLTLSVGNSYGGGTTINEGTVTLGNAAALGASAGAVSVASGARLNMNGINVANTNPLTLNGSGIGGTGALINTTGTGIYIGAITLAGNTTIGQTGGAKLELNSSTKLNTAGYTVTFKGSTAGQIMFKPAASGITGSGNVVVDGAYLMLVFGGGNISVNDYTGTTTIINGGLILYFNNNIGTGNISLNGGTLAGYSSAGFTRPFGAASGQFQITGGESGFGMNGSGTINFSNVNEVKWETASFNPSKFIVGGGAGAFGGTVTFAEGIDLNGANRTILTTDIGVLSGVIRNTSGTPAGLIKEGGGTLTLSVANSYNGPTTISAGTLKAGIANTLPNGAGKGNVVLNGGATAGILDLASFDIAINGLDGTTGATLGQVINSTAGTKTLTLGNGDASGSFAGLIKTGTGNINLTKTGTGSQTLSGANTFTGATTVNSGTLVVNGSLAAGSAVTVNNSGKLGGSGTIGGSATFNNGSTFASENGFLIINGLLTLNAGVTLSVGSVSGNSVILIASYGTRSGTFDTVSLPQGWKVDYDYEGNNQIALVPPQPSVFRFR